MAEYIEREAVLEKAWDADTRCGYVQVVDVGDIKAIPAADVVPVVHGRWVPSITGHDVCSECRKIYTSGWFTAHGIKARESFNYCPNCGARMDGE